MPFQDAGGLPTLSQPLDVVTVRTVTDQPTVGGFTSPTDGSAPAPLVSDQPTSVQQAIASASNAVKIIPTATAPAIANLPHNAKPGEWFQFASQPSVIYVMGPDNVWRAILLVPVV